MVKQKTAIDSDNYASLTRIDNDIVTAIKTRARLAQDGSLPEELTVPEMDKIIERLETERAGVLAIIESNTTSN